MGGAYGYCEAGYCQVGGAGSGHASWAVGLALSLFFYLVLTLCFLWIYCRYRPTVKCCKHIFLLINFDIDTIINP